MITVTRGISLLLITAMFPIYVFGAGETPEVTKVMSDAEALVNILWDGYLNVSSHKPRPYEVLAFNQHDKNYDNLENYITFKTACAENNLATIQSMLVEKKVNSGEAGIALNNLGDNVNDECHKAVADIYPYALWDGGKINTLRGDPYFSEADVEKYLNHGFMIPYLKKEPRAICISSPVLHHYLIWYPTTRPVKKDEEITQELLCEPNYTIIKKLLELGCNPHFKAYSWLHRCSHNEADKYVDAFALTASKKPEVEPKLKALLEKYARQPINGEYNTTDMFYPGTKFYRETKKETPQQ